ncbi:MAG: amino acid ABC transporter substrate-binding protein [Aphanocapsa feldmannii 288cV]|nr:MAG: amino acid ABC transporter substrate-binding protein [Aphanocapsa feldmannii 288cV]
MVRLLKRLAAVSLVSLLGACAGGAPESMSRLDTVKERGELQCGVSGKLPGFSFLRTDGSYDGIDVDICRAVAAVVLGDSSAVDYRQLSAPERFTALRSGEIDLLSRNTTATLSRDSEGGNGLTFAPVVFYDGQGLMVRADSGIATMEDLEGRTVCVGSGTTTERNLSDAFLAAGVNYNALKFQEKDQVASAYLQGRCESITSDRSGLASMRSGFDDPSAHRILNAVLSKEPLAPATVAGDPRWSDAVRWTIYGLIAAEEFGISSANIQAMVNAAAADPNQAAMRRFLGVDGGLGTKLGLPDDFVVRAVSAVGNYGEIYDRHLGPGSDVPIPRDLNSGYRDGGLHYAPPFN